MRSPFPYENQASLLQDLLVPDPLPVATFLAARKNWQLNPQGLSFAAYMVSHHVLQVGDWFRILQAATGAHVVDDPIPLAPHAIAPEDHALIAAGYAVFNDAHGNRYYSGGELMFQHTSANRPTSNRQWAILSPLADWRPGTAIDGHSSIDSSASAGAGSPSLLQKKLRQLIESQLAAGQADIHFHMIGGQLQIHSRKHQRMQVIASLQGHEASQCMRLLKRWGNLSTAANALPQEGRIDIDFGIGPVCLRIATLTTFNGEGLVLRLLGSEMPLRLQDLMIPLPLQALIDRTVRAANSMLIASGPTGSGKTSTIATLLRERIPAHHKLISIEDPVEHEIRTALQSSVNETTGWTYPAAIKAFLRHDPDHLFIGEMRDATVARMATSAALTGHGVFSTIHAQDEVTVIDRMRQWGIPAGMLTESIGLIINQRLKRNTDDGRYRTVFGWWAPTCDELKHYIECGDKPQISKRYQPLFPVGTQLEAEIMGSI